MSNSNVCRADGTSHDDKGRENNTSEQKNYDCNQNKGTDEKLSESEVKITTKCDENLKIKVENIGNPCTVKKDTVIDLKDEPFQNVSNKIITSFNNQDTYLQKCFKFIIREPRQEYLMNQTNIKTWVQYSLGQGQGFGKGTVDYDPERNSFILLVMMIVLVMLLITAGWIILVFTVEDLNNIFRKPSMFLVFGASGGLMIIYYIMMCVPAARRPPCSFIMLILTVVFTCLVAAVVTCRFETIILFYAFLATSAIALACAALACTSFDFTSFWLYFVVISVGFSVVAMCIMIGMMVTGTYIKTAHLIILCITVILQSVGLVMELQMILGGRSIELDESEYALAAFMLYTSLVKMFLNLVQIIGLLDND